MCVALQFHRRRLHRVSSSPARGRPHAMPRQPRRPKANRLHDRRLPDGRTRPRPEPVDPRPSRLRPEALPRTAAARRYGGELARRFPQVVHGATQPRGNDQRFPAEQCTQHCSLTRGTVRALARILFLLRQRAEIRGPQS